MNTQLTNTTQATLLHKRQKKKNTDRHTTIKRKYNPLTLHLMTDTLRYTMRHAIQIKHTLKNTYQSTQTANSHISFYNTTIICNSMNKCKALREIQMRDYLQQALPVSFS